MKDLGIEETEPEPSVTDGRLVAELTSNESTEGGELPVSIIGRMVALLPVIMCFLGTGRSDWALGLMAITVGILVLWFPPQSRLPFALLVVMGSIAGLTLLALIPVQVLFQPSWRVRLAEDVGIPLGRTWSAQPLVTLENWLFLVVIMVWFAWLVTQDRVAEQRAHILRVVSSGIAWLAVLSTVFYFKGWHPPTWTSGSKWDIGPFANRNHVSTLMAMNAILCLATSYDLMRRKRRQWVYYGLGIVPCFAVVLLNTSRAGLFLFFLGVLSWFFAASLRKRSLKRLAIGGALLLALTSGTVLFAQTLLARFVRTDIGVLESLATDSRFTLYADTFDLILQNPVLGVGLGNFASVFGFTNHMENVYTRYRHPESDLLWFMSEAGWPATIAALIGVLIFVLWIGPWRSVSKGARRRERRLRLAAGFAVLLALIHGLIDTPGHQMPMALLMALMAALALYGSKVARSPGILTVRSLRVAGLVCVLAGVAWFVSAAGYHTPMGESGWSRDLEIAHKALNADDTAKGWLAAQGAVRAAPLSWEAYFMRASVGLRMGRSANETMQDFGRARYLEPNAAIICMNEADVWLSFNPLFAIPAWREALKRDHVEPLNEYYAMLTAAQRLPELRLPVRSLATQSRLLLAYLRSCSSDQEFQEVITDMLSRFPELEGLSRVDRAQLFQLWRTRGNRKSLVAALESHPRWLEDGWLVLAQEEAEAGHSQRAYELAMAHMTAPVSVSSETTVTIEMLQREFLFNPSDAKRGFNLAFVQRERQQYSAALNTLEKIAALPNAPKHVYYEMAKVYAKMNNFVKAWESMAKYLQL